ncbi:hypothetical protein SUGI_0276270 [Cryptomeria japonica]|uniref:sister chromatid cohesion protein PDS5 homolog A isoform X2 n=1 Tax=Cryptomeria japonica TaxID=3369 RepID=UPI002408EF97|nr:sister chromatid cohesion protein PDS5 homolog A isoform X2 [Cryptomeria japonica]GLJ16335.1 hypothetical protein SUGI_0276270 [Cryptomeria japonica]
MANQLEQQILEVGRKLQHPPHSKEALIKILKQVASYLSEVDQSPSQTMLRALRPSMNSLVAPELLGHRDKDVTLLVATCISEITRITAPEAPYSDDVLKDIFRLIVGTFRGLDETTNPSFGRRVSILETVARIRSCVVMLDLECDGLIIEMFHIFFSVVSEAHPENVLKSMQSIMTLILDESDTISEQLLAIVLSSLGREKGDVSPAARRLGMLVLEQCAITLEPYVYRFIESAKSAEEKLQGVLHSHYYDVIYDIYQCAPQMLERVIPNMKQELLTDQLDVRLSSVKLLGRLFAIPGHPLPELFQPLFAEFLKRFTDKDVEVRLSVVEHVKECLLSNPFRHEAADIISALNARLLDYDENVRKQVVAAICDVANYALKSIPVEIIRHVAERLRDKVVFVRMYTLERLAEIYRVYCSKFLDGSISDYEFEWIPQKIIMCCYDKDFRAQAIELVFSESLFPSELPVVERVKHWIMMYSKFEKFEVKALEGVLAQKQRLQQEMQSYLLLREKMKEYNTVEFEKRILSCFKSMSLSFKDPPKAEESFQKLNQLKDNKIWKALTSLLDPSNYFLQAEQIYIDMLQRLGDKHPQYDFIKMLGAKCSYRLFNKEHVKETLKEITVNKLAGRDDLIKSAMNLLVLFAGFFPFLLQGSEEDLIQLLKEDNECIKEGVVHIIAKAGVLIGEQMTDTTSSLDLLLETLCVEGSRQQAKYAVQALAAIMEDAGLKALSVLYKRLVDTLESGTHLPSILQSLGCIAQNAMPVFETREEDVVHFVHDNLLRRNSNPSDVFKTEWEDRSEECLLKIYGVKTLVKSYLPKKDSHLRQRIETLLGILARILTSGEISKDVKSSEVDKAHMRLAAAKALLRLSRHWDQQITPELFYLGLQISQDPYPEVRREFLGKVHQYLKQRTLDQKYACAFVFGISGMDDDDVIEVKQYLFDFVETYHQGVQLRQTYAHSDGSLLTSCPEYVIAYLVHALAHHPKFPSITGDLRAEAFESLYRQLHFFLSAFMHRDGDGHNDSERKRGQESFSIITTIFQTIKCAEDAVDKSKSEKLYALCDLGLSITKEFIQHTVPSLEFRMSVSLPGVLYKQLEDSKGMALKANVTDCTTSRFGSGFFAHFQAPSTHCMTHSTPDQTSKDGTDQNVTEESDKNDFEEPLRVMLHSGNLQGIRKKKSSGGRRYTNVANLLKVCGNKDSIDLPETAKDQVDKPLENQETIKLSVPVSNGTEGRRDSAPNQYTIDNIMRINAENMILPKKKRSRPRKDREDGAGSESHPPKRGHWKSLGKGGDSKEERNLVGLTTGRAEMVSATSNGAEEKHFESASSQKSELSKDFLQNASGLGISRNSSPKYLQESLPQTQKDFRYTDTPEANQHVQLPKRKPVARVEFDSKFPCESLKSRVTHRKPRKKKSISGLQKSTEKLKKEKFDYEKLAGHRIKVWWPLDKQFYEGIVQSYDSIQKKHTVLYDDGDVEVLRLQKERWELTDNDLSLERPALVSPKSSKNVEAMPVKERTQMGALEGKKAVSSNKRGSVSKSTKKGTFKSHYKSNDNGVSPKSMELDTSRVKVGDPFLSMDEKSQPSGGKRGKRKSELDTSRVKVGNPFLSMDEKTQPSGGKRGKRKSELDTSRVKVGNPFLSMDEKSQPSGGKRRKRKSELDTTRVKVGDPFLSMDEKSQPSVGKRGKRKSELDTSRVKVGDPFLSMDEKSQLSGGKRGKRKSELDTSRVKVGDPFLSMDEKSQLSGGKRGKRKSGSKGRKGGSFAISTNITSGTSKDPKQTSTTVDTKNGGVPDSGSRDSDDEPLNSWWSRIRKIH